MVKKINAIEYAYLKSLKDQNKNLICESILKRNCDLIEEGLWSSIKSGVSSAYNAVKNVAKKVGDAVGGWLKSLWNLITSGIALIKGFLSGSYKTNPKQLETDHTDVTTNCVKVLPFMKKPLNIIETAGNKAHEHEYKDLKNEIKGTNSTSAENKPANVDKSIKNIGNSLWTNVKGDLLNCFKSEQKDAKELGQSLAEKDNANANTNTNTNNENPSNSNQDSTNNTIQANTSQDINQQNITQTSENPVTEEYNQINEITFAGCSSKITSKDIKILNEGAKNISHDLHELIIEYVYHGITPKLLIETVDNEQHTNSIQPDLIIENKLLKFKTNNGNLICEETDLSTNDKIIWESNTKFKGSHLIFEENENIYKTFNHIITEEDEKEYRELLTEGSIAFTILMWVGIGALFIGLMSLLKKAIVMLIAAITAGFGAAVGLVADEGTKPVDGAAGTQAGSAVANGGAKAAAKNVIVKKTGTAIGKGTGHIAKRAVANGGTKAAAKNVIVKTGTTIGKGAGYIAKHKVLAAATATAVGGAGVALNDDIADQAEEELKEYENADKNKLKDVLDKVRSTPAKNKDDSKLKAAKIKILNKWIKEA